MDTARLHDLLSRVSNGQVAVEQAVEALKTLPFEDLGFARVDHHRRLRTGLPEVIFSPGKTVDQIAAIAQRLSAGGHHVLMTRLEADRADALGSLLPALRYYAEGPAGQPRTAAQPAARAGQPAGRCGRDGRFPRC